MDRVRRGMECFGTIIYDGVETLEVAVCILAFIYPRGAIMATKKAVGTQVSSDKSMKKTSKRMESTKKKSITKKGEGKYESGRRG